VNNRLLADTGLSVLVVANRRSRPIPALQMLR
jgi:hypothetical protein